MKLNQSAFFLQISSSCLLVKLFRCVQSENYIANHLKAKNYCENFYHLFMTSRKETCLQSSFASEIPENLEMFPLYYMYSNVCINRIVCYLSRTNAVYYVSISLLTKPLHIL